MSESGDIGVDALPGVTIPPAAADGRAPRAPTALRHASTVLPPASESSISVPGRPGVLRFDVGGDVPRGVAIGPDAADGRARRAPTALRHASTALLPASDSSVSMPCPLSSGVGARRARPSSIADNPSAVHAPPSVHTPRLSARWSLLPALALLLLASCTSRASKPHPADLQRLLTSTPPSPAPRFQPLTAEQRKGLAIDTVEVYKIGINDVLDVQSSSTLLKGFGETNMGTTKGTKVKSDGKIYLPGFPEPFQAAGRTAIDLQTEVHDKLLEIISKDEKEPKNPNVSIDVLTYLSQKAYVQGEGGLPIMVFLDGETTLSQAVAKAGLLTKEADVEQIFLVRNKKVLPVSFADVRRGDLEQDLVLRHNDLVYVPSLKVERVIVLGEVGSPGVFPFQGDGANRRMTLVEAVARAGGLKAESADVNQICVFRGGWCNPEVFTISACELYTHGENIRLSPGDRVLVAPMTEATWGRALSLATPFLTTPLAIGTTLLAIQATAK